MPPGQLSSPSGMQMIHRLYLAIFICIGIYHLIVQKKTIKVVIFLSLILCLFVYTTLNENVKNASTHGNTIHGWYSQYNTTEKTIAVAWVIGFPLACYIAIILFFSPQQKNKSGNDQKKVFDGTEKIKVAAPHTKNNKTLYRATTTVINKPQKPENISKKFYRVDTRPIIKKVDIEEQICPKCGSNMVIRVAKKGRYKGKRFWGCKKYPSCRGIVNIDG